MTDIEIKKFIAEQLNAGVGLSAIQSDVDAKFGKKYTFLEMRLLAAELENVDWSKQDPAEPAPAEEAPAPEPEPGDGQCHVELNKLIRPGALANGTVKFASGSTAEWLLDQSGRLGLDNVVGEPSEDDIVGFQNELKRMFAKGI